VVLAMVGARNGKSAKPVCGRSDGAAEVLPSRAVIR
jgi:hypothetical protein